MIVGSDKCYHSMKQSIIMHENFDKSFAKAINKMLVLSVVLNVHHNIVTQVLLINIIVKANI